MGPPSLPQCSAPQLLSCWLQVGSHLRTLLAQLCQHCSLRVSVDCGNSAWHEGRNPLSTDGCYFSKNSSGLRLKLRRLLPPSSLKQAPGRDLTSGVGSAVGDISEGSHCRVVVCRVGYGQWPGVTRKGSQVPSQRSQGGAASGFYLVSAV